MKSQAARQKWTLHGYGLVNSSPREGDWVCGYEHMCVHAGDSHQRQHWPGLVTPFSWMSFWKPVKDFDLAVRGPGEPLWVQRRWVTWWDRWHFSPMKKWSGINKRSHFALSVKWNGDAKDWCWEEEYLLEGHQFWPYSTWNHVHKWNCEELCYSMWIW